MKIALAKELLSRTPSSKCRIIKLAENGKWQVQILCGKDWETLISDRGKERIFTTSDAAIKTVAEIGFEDVNVKYIKGLGMNESDWAMEQLNKVLPRN